MMDAKEYIRERLRMFNVCGGKEGNCADIDCEDCPLYEDSLGCQDYTEKSVDIVEKWSEEHPRRTYLDVLLEVFPNVPLNEVDGSPHFCPINIGLEEHVDADMCAKTSCLDCWRRECKERV